MIHLHFWELFHFRPFATPRMHLFPGKGTLPRTLHQGSRGQSKKTLVKSGCLLISMAVSAAEIC